MANKELPEKIENCIDALGTMNKELHSLAIDLLLDGELKSPIEVPLGETFPYDFDLYIHDSLDPNVQEIAKLMGIVNETIETIKSNVKSV